MATQKTSNQIPIYTVDAFTSKTFTGNPAAVCTLTKIIDDETCQKIAFEMNVSETAFIRLLNPNDSFEKSSHFGLRWFTPTHEVPLCGHATLASATVLFHVYNNINKEVKFQTMRGELICRKTDDGMIAMDFPQWRVAKANMNDLFTSLVKETVGDLPVQDVWYSDDSKKLLIILENSIERVSIQQLKVNANALMKLHPSGEIVKGVAVTLQGTPQNGCNDCHGEMYDFVDRYFAPWYGVNEDPVTGSLHCALGPYWAKVLKKNELFAQQCSPRCGEMKLTIRDDGRIELKGKSVVVISGLINF